MAEGILLGAVHFTGSMFWVWGVFACLFVFYSPTGNWEAKSKLLVDQVEGTGGEHGTWQSWMQAGFFPHILFPLLSACAWISLLFFCSQASSHFCGNSWFPGKLVLTCAWRKLQKGIDFSVFTGLSLRTRPVFQQPWWLSACFQMQFQILCFPFSLRWCGFWLCDILTNLEQHVGVLVLTVLKSSACWGRQCWRYSLCVCIYRITYSEIHLSPHPRELVCTGLQRSEKCLVFNKVFA